MESARCFPPSHFIFCNTLGGKLLPRLMSTKEVSPEENGFTNPPPWEGLRMFIRVLWEKGIPKEHLKKMVQDNPYFLLNL